MESFSKISLITEIARDPVFFFHSFIHGEVTQVKKRKNCFNAPKTFFGQDAEDYFRKFVSYVINIYL